MLLAQAMRDRIRRPREKPGRRANREIDEGNKRAQ